ncbi:MAG TPA: DUF4296 domain-containing protein [Mariniflexile sp.]|nr:DUF4296 domain-containing protein [Mariniflexile sp.]
MLKQFVSFFCIMALVASCSFGGPKKPKNLISKKNMVAILIDAKLLATATSTNQSILESHGVQINRYIFEKYGIDSLQFAESNKYYAHKIKDYEEIYTKVTDSLERLKVALKELELKEEKKKKKETDSINAVTAKDSLAAVLVKKALNPEEGILISPASDKNSPLYK